MHIERKEIALHTCRSVLFGLIFKFSDEIDLFQL